MTVADFIKRLDAATNVIAERLKKLVADSTNLTPEQASEIEGDIVRLEAMGRDSNNPFSI